MPAPAAQQLHSTVHSARPALAGVAKGGSTVQKIQLDKVEAPVVQHPVKYPAQIVQHGRVVDIQRIESCSSCCRSTTVCRPLSAASPGAAGKGQSPFRTQRVQAIAQPEIRRREFPPPCLSARGGISAYPFPANRPTFGSQPSSIWNRSPGQSRLRHPVRSSRMVSSVMF